MRTNKTVEERFWAKVAKSPGCWLWTASISWDGYGCFSVSRHTKVRAHRYSYELENGPIPEGLVVDHLCRVRHCVNPAHLEATTDYENRMRGEGPHAQNRRKTHCIRGHEFSPANTHVNPKGGRVCKTCRLEWHRANPTRRPKKGASE